MLRAQTVSFPTTPGLRRYPEGIKSFSPVLEVAVRKDLRRVFVENRLVGRRCSAASLGGAAAPPDPLGLRNNPAGERAPLAVDLLSRVAESLPTHDGNRDSGPASANGGWLAHG